MLMLEMSIVNHDGYLSKMERLVSELFDVIYEEVWQWESHTEEESEEDGYIVSIGRIMELLYAEIYVSEKTDLIEAALQRKDYEVFGMDEDEFFNQAWSEAICDDALKPYIDYKLISKIVEERIARFKIFVCGYRGELVNPPVSKVW